MVLSSGSLLADIPGIAWVFIVSVLAIAVVMNWRWGMATVTHGPTILTTIGIFGTFFGIAWSLTGLDTTNVAGSVPLLLEGVRTSFWSSIAGLGSALQIKLRHLFQISKKEAHVGPITGATVDDLATLLRELRDVISSPGSEPLVVEMVKSREQSKAQLDRLHSTLVDFQDNMARLNSEALVEALREVIRDFNAKINEQFGENFKQLNKACENILEWQERYRQQLTEMIEQQQKSAVSMAASARSFRVVAEQSGSLTTAALSMGRVLDAVAEERLRVQQQMTMLSKILESVAKEMPNFEERVNAILRMVSDSVRDNAKRSADAIVEANRLATSALEGLQSNMATKLSELAQHTDGQVARLERSLERELTQSLSILGNQLAALSEKFAADYMPLTEKLKQVVHLAEGYESRRSQAPGAASRV